jgi:hypothetical protein
MARRKVEALKFNARLPGALYERLRARADEDCVSVNTALVQAVIHYLATTDSGLKRLKAADDEGAPPPQDRRRPTSPAALPPAAAAEDSVPKASTGSTSSEVERRQAHPSADARPRGASSLRRQARQPAEPKQGLLDLDPEDPEPFQQQDPVIGEYVPPQYRTADEIYDEHGRYLGRRPSSRSR